jgi:peptidyl-dipeptidase A
MESELRTFLSKYDSIAKPLEHDMNLANWEASVSGKAEDYARSETSEKKYSQFHSNKDDFKKLEKINASGTIQDTLLQRQLHVLYLRYLSHQADTGLQNEIIEMKTRIEKKYNNFRAEVKGKKLSDNEIENILSNSANSIELQEAWEAHKKIGTLVAADIIELIKKRNQEARELGFSNYHEMSLKLDDQEPADIEKIFEELDSLTRNSFIKAKSEVDSFLAARDHIKKDQLMPWHYQNRYFQEAPKIYNIDLDKYFAGKNLEDITSKYYSGIGIPIEDLIAKSDLYEKPGKNQHAFCADINNEGDVRVLCNIKPNAYWMNTMLHEFGHAAYQKYIDHKLPYSLRQPAHTFTTEAIAMMFGRFNRNAQWLQDNVNINESEKSKIADACFKSLRLEQLVFSRWAQVMYHFEKSMYENPDQDLNKLWWAIVEKYQMIKMPEGRNAPDWASKIHIATVPCYYHNYLLGELLASQLHYYICNHVLKDTINYNMVSYFNKPEVGHYLRDKVFGPGLLYYWNDMIERATGEKLTAKYYAKQFVE